MMITGGSKHHLRQPPSPNDAINWVIQAKQALHDNPEKLNTLYKTVFAFRDHEIDTPTMVNTMEQLLHGHTNLLESINTFLTEGYTVGDDEDHNVGDEDHNVGDEDHNVGDEDHSCLSQGIEFVNKVYRRFGKDRKVFSSFLNIMHEHVDNTVGVFEKVSVLFREFPELISAFAAFLPEEPECGPSYRRKMTEDPKSRLTVLNDDWICKARTTTVSERPAMDEKAVLQWEDDRYEIDMLIERGKTAIVHIDGILTERTNDTQLSVMDLRFIEKLYSEQGLTMVDLVKKDPQRTLPVVKERVDRTVVQLTMIRQEMNREARVYHKKSTDPMQSDGNSDH